MEANKSNNGMPKEAQEALPKFMELLDTIEPKLTPEQNEIISRAKIMVGKLDEQGIKNLINELSKKK